MNKDAKYVFLFTLLLLMIICDYIWLNFIAKGLFESQLKYILGFKTGEFEIRTLKTSMGYFLVGISILFLFDPSAKDKERAITLGGLVGAMVYSVLEF